MSTYNRTRKGFDRGPTDHYRRRRRHRSIKADKASVGTPSGHPTLGQVADREFLIDTYNALKARGGHAPGNDRLTYADLGPSEVAQIMDALAVTIGAGTYGPGPARKQPIPKSGGRGTRTLSIRSIVDRVVSAALDRVLTPTFEPLFKGRARTASAPAAAPGTCWPTWGPRWPPPADVSWRSTTSGRRSTTSSSPS